jgi:hypothetical protein
MTKALTARKGFSEYAPKIETMTIPTDKIREVIGSGGKVIREIVETSGAKVDINDDGTIKIASNDQKAIKKAYDMIWSIVAEPEEGQIYTGKVVKLVDFRRLRELLRQARRSGACVPDRQQAPEPPERDAEGRPGSEGQASGLRRPRQGPPRHEDGRPGNRRPKEIAPTCRPSIGRCSNFPFHPACGGRLSLAGTAEEDKADAISADPRSGGSTPPMAACLPGCHGQAWSRTGRFPCFPTSSGTLPSSGGLASGSVVRAFRCAATC